MSTPDSQQYKKAERQRWGQCSYRIAKVVEGG